MNNIKEVIKYIAEAREKRDRGTAFEDLIRLYFKYDYKPKDYEEVYTYADWANKNGFESADKKDNGIDLVAVPKDGSKADAIQCKFKTKNDAICSQDDVKSFFTAAPNNIFAHRYLVASTYNLTENLKSNLKKHENFSIIGLSDLENSRIDFLKYLNTGEVVKEDAKSLHPHQTKAVHKTLEAFKEHDRGQLRMACGTGKTFTSLKIAELCAENHKTVLFLVPSLALMNQTIREYKQQSDVITAFAVCSDATVGKTKNKNEDTITQYIYELAYPATTNAENLKKAFNKVKTDGIKVIFSTYHSIDVIHEAQQGENNIGEFDIIICDEAHRTTGQKIENDEDCSFFIKIHDNDYIKSTKRLYMTATPKIYTETATTKAAINNATLYSMNDEKIFGPVFYSYNFDTAVSEGILCDYKLTILTINKSELKDFFNNFNSFFEERALNIDDATKLIGCWKALTGQPNFLEGDESEVNIKEPLKRLVAFCQIIDSTQSKKKQKPLGSKQVAKYFTDVINHYKEYNQNYIDAIADEYPEYERNLNVECQLEHVDGTMDGTKKSGKISWLKEEPDANENNNEICRILTNVRCLGEGVDVPALDGIIFLHPKNSIIEVVQAVGRVMRKAKGKENGHIILPIVIDDAKDAHLKIEKNADYKVVWQVLNALRAHDESIAADLQLGAKGELTNKLELICYGEYKEQAKIMKLNSSPFTAIGKKNKNKTNNDIEAENINNKKLQAAFNFEDQNNLKKAICQIGVKKVGDRKYWQEWGEKTAELTQKVIEKITDIINSDKVKNEYFNEFLKSLHNEINDSIGIKEAIELLAQHYVTMPIFDALFDDYDFSEHNPVVRAFENICQKLKLDISNLDFEQLNEFYASVHIRAKNAKHPALRQELMLELYDSFYKEAFKDMVDLLGITFTPIEAVNFIINKTNDALKLHFGETFASENIKVIDPFAGTGVFPASLLQNNDIFKTIDEKLDLYRNRLFASEIVPLSYYIAAINIETTMQQITQLPYEPFENITLADSFINLYKNNNKNLIPDEYFYGNNKRRTTVKNAKINVIITNPPYSRGQRDGNDNNKNISYPELEQDIKNTYVKDCLDKGLKNSLYDSYIKALRLATDKIGNKGVIGFIIPNGILYKATMNGIRKHLAQDFSHLYFLNLRGDIRVNMLSKGTAREGENIFGNGSQNGICIAILVKNPNSTTYSPDTPANIYYHDIGDNLTTEQKKQILNNLPALPDISWQNITPNEHLDWLNQRDSNPQTYETFKKYLPLKDFFITTTSGVKSNRDRWVYNYAKTKLANNMQVTIDYYNNERHKSQTIENYEPTINAKKIKWTINLKKCLTRNIEAIYDANKIVPAIYYPFTSLNLYYDNIFNNILGKLTKVFPSGYENNKIIAVTNEKTQSTFSVIIINKIPNYNLLQTGKCYPLYIYDNANNNNNNELYNNENENNRQYAIKKEYLNKFSTALNHNISYEELFYYIYAILNSPEYTNIYANILKSEIPHIPLATNYASFKAFSDAGKKLSDLHINYENGTLCHDTNIIFNGKHISLTELKNQPSDIFYVKKMKRKDNNIIYNQHISLINIPNQAFEYKIANLSAIDWVINQQKTSIDKDTGIINDPNDYAIENMQNPAYILELLLRVIQISLDTCDILNNLPKLSILETQ